MDADVLVGRAGVRSLALRWISVAASALDTGQFCLASLQSLEISHPQFRMSASVSTLECVIENADPSFSSLPGNVWSRFGTNPALESCAVRAMVNQPAWLRFQAPGVSQALN